MTDGTETVPGAEAGQAGDPGIDIPAVPAEDAAAEPKVAELEGEVARLKDQLLRALADQENLRRRAERDREDAGKFAIVAFARDMVSVADNLRRALESLPPEAEDEDETVRNLRQGVDATERELVGALERRGVKRIDPMGERFDPNFHEAMFEVPGGDQPAGTVVQVLQPGYLIHERLLRPARVAVVKSDAQPQRVDTTA